MSERLLVLTQGPVTTESMWMAFPRPFTPGARITATYRDRDGRELARRTIEPK